MFVSDLNPVTYLYNKHYYLSILMSVVLVRWPSYPVCPLSSVLSESMFAHWEQSFRGTVRKCLHVCILHDDIFQSQQKSLVLWNWLWTQCNLCPGYHLIPNRFERREKLKPHSSLVLCSRFTMIFMIQFTIVKWQYFRIWFTDIK